MNHLSAAWRVLSGDCRAESARATVVQLLLVFLTIPAALLAESYAVDWLYRERRARYRMPIDQLGGPFTSAYDIVLRGLGLLALAGGVGLAAWFVYRFAASRGRPEFRRFVRNWWRACLWAMLFAAIVLAVAASQPSKLVAQMTILLDVAFLVIAPAVLAREELGAPRRSRWRPVCPECGYSVMHAAVPRCPECGTNYPTERTLYRRWAIRRAAWDRADRGVLPITYFRTLLSLGLCPCRTARSLANPDHYPRAVRWAVLHLVAAAMLATMLGSHQYYLHLLFPDVRNLTMQVQFWFETDNASVLRRLCWLFESLVTWLAFLAALPASGCLLASLVPRMQPAARAAIAKWSLYSTALLAPMVGVAFLLNEWEASGVLGGTRLRLPIVLHTQRPSPWAIVAFFGCWWAAGLLRNPWLRQRGMRAWILGAFSILALWLLLVVVLAPPGPLVSLL